MKPLGHTFWNIFAGLGAVLLAVWVLVLRDKPRLSAAEAQAVRSALVSEYVYGDEETDQRTEIGRMFLKGNVLPQDTKRGMEWLRAGAKAGDRDAIYELGVLYASGPEENTLKAWRYLWRSLQSGDRRAAQFLVKHEQFRRFYEGDPALKDRVELMGLPSLGVSEDQIARVLELQRPFRELERSDGWRARTAIGGDNNLFAEFWGDPSNLAGISIRLLLPESLNPFDEDVLTSVASVAEDCDGVLARDWVIAAVRNAMADPRLGKNALYEEGTCGIRIVRGTPENKAFAHQFDISLLPK